MHARLIASIAVLLVAPARAGELVEALPPSTIAAVSIDVGRAVRELPELELVKLYQDEEVSEFLAGATEFAKGESRQLMAGLRLLKMYGLPDMISGKVVLAFTGFGRRQEGGIDWSAPLEEPNSTDHVANAALLVETTGPDAFGESVMRALELIPEEMETVDVAHESFPHQVTRFLSGRPPIPDVLTGFVGDVFIATHDPGLYLELAGALAADRADGGLAAHEGFARVDASASRRVGVLDLYVNFSEAWGMVPPDVFAQFEAIGLSSLQAGGLSIGVDGGRIKESLTLVTGQERAGVLSLLDAFIPGAAGRDVPADADAAFALGLDGTELLDRLLAFYDTIGPDVRRQAEESLTAFGYALDVQDFRGDLLAALGDRIVLWAKAKAGPIPIPDGGMIVGLDDVDKALEVIPNMFGGATGDDALLQPLKVDGATAAYYVRAELPVQPAFAVVDGRLVAATQPAVLKRRLASPGAKLASDADFSKCLAMNAGQGGDDVVALIYFDLATIIESALTSVEPFLPALLADTGPVELDASLMPFPDTVASYLSGYLLTVRKTDRVLALDASSPVGGMWLGAAAAWFLIAPQPVETAPYVKSLFESEDR